MICIIDYGMGNVGSIRNMLRKQGHESVVSESLEVIGAAEKLILPGVGAFDHGMKRLESTGIREVLDERVLCEGVPILGICLGMQMLLKGSEEGGGAGLSWIPGRSRRFDFSDVVNAPPVPHMGWNHLQVVANHPILKEVDDRSRFYFVHSFHVVPEREEHVLARTVYSGFEFVSAIHHKRILGMQFHPEKSHKFGMRILDNFARQY
ncbi:imidazole glycerol phosphate synthase subunit HisH [Akkermansiaceae bacterium]|nr:imidazole glycerol phosphate synthase subunit HisH [Akkermansiaceae bacterium]